MTMALSTPLQPLRIGLALGGGMARGWALIGVLKTLAGFGIVPSIIAGTSMGAVVGAAAAAGGLDQLEGWARNLGRTSFWRHMSWHGRGGLFDSDRLGTQMTQNLGEWCIEELPTPFAAVASDLTTGQEVWLRSGRLSDAVRASFAMPGFFAPVTIAGRTLADGFLVNPVPVSAARAMGADLVIAVSLSSEDPRPQAMRSGKLSMAGTLGASFHIIQQRLTRSRMATDPPDVHIAIPCQNVGVLEFHRADALIAMGIEAVYHAAPRLENAMALIASGHGHGA
jgi:NTE family protein